MNFTYLQIAINKSNDSRVLVDRVPFIESRDYLQLTYWILPNYLQNPLLSESLQHKYSQQIFSQHTWNINIHYI